jgi:hypothetical protein
MTSHNGSKKTSRTLSAKLIACALSVMMSASVALTGCATNSSAAKVSPQLYQPRVLQLTPEVEIQTAQGRYKPQAPETWHSDRAYRELEAQVIDLSAALTQERNRK